MPPRSLKQQVLSLRQLNSSERAIALWTQLTFLHRCQRFLISPKCEVIFKGFLTQFDSFKLIIFNCFSQKQISIPTVIKNFSHYLFAFYITVKY